MDTSNCLTTAGKVEKGTIAEAEKIYASIPFVKLSAGQQTVLLATVNQMISDAFLLSGAYPELAEKITGVVVTEILLYLTGGTPRPGRGVWDEVMMAAGRNEGESFKLLLEKYQYLRRFGISEGKIKHGTAAELPANSPVANKKTAPAKIRQENKPTKAAARVNQAERIFDYANVEMWIKDVRNSKKELRAKIYDADNILRVLVEEIALYQKTTNRGRELTPLLTRAQFSSEKGAAGLVNLLGEMQELNMMLMENKRRDS